MRDYIFKRLLFLCSLLVLLICGGMVYSLVSGAVPAFEKFGFFHFISSVEWDPRPGNEQYGALAHHGNHYDLIFSRYFVFRFLYLWLYSPANISGVPGQPRSSVRSSTCWPGIPSIVYGLWGFYTLRPFMVDLQLSEQGFGIFTAAVVLAVMIIPYASSLSAEFISMVPKELKEGAYSLGGTRLDVIRRVIFPVAGSGIFASYILALGRALGETMAVTMLIGNTNILPTSFTSTGNTMASVIANQFGEADGLKLSSLIAIGLLLFLITAIINFIGKMIMKKLS